MIPTTEDRSVVVLTLSNSINKNRFQDGFEEVYQQCVKYSNAFLDAVAEKE